MAAAQRAGASATGGSSASTPRVRLYGPEKMTQGPPGRPAARPHDPTAPPPSRRRCRRPPPPPSSKPTCRHLPPSPQDEDGFLSREAASHAESSKIAMEELKSQLAGMCGWLAPFAAHLPVKAALPLLDEMQALVPQAVQWPALAVKVLRNLLYALAKLRKHLGCERTAAWAAQRVLDLVSCSHTCFGAVPLLVSPIWRRLYGLSGGVKASRQADVFLACMRELCSKQRLLLFHRLAAARCRPATDATACLLHHSHRTKGWTSCCWAAAGWAHATEPCWSTPLWRWACAWAWTRPWVSGDGSWGGLPGSLTALFSSCQVSAWPHARIHARRHQHHMRPPATL